MEYPFQKYLDEGKITKEFIGPEQIRSAYAGASEDLKAADFNLQAYAKVTYDYAYKAMQKMGRALILSFGYRPKVTNYHKTVIDLSGEILGKEFSELIAHFDRMRQKRNAFTYNEPDLVISQTEATNALKTANDFLLVVKNFINKNGHQGILL